MDKNEERKAERRSGPAGGLSLRKIAKYLSAATRVIAFSEQQKSGLAERFAVPEQKIQVIYPGPAEGFQPLEEAQQQSVREQFTAGASYIIYMGRIAPQQEVVNLLKAFSVFKKRQQTSMKLVLAGRVAWEGEGFTPLLNTYKYRQDVVLLDQPAQPDLEALLAAAYACVSADAAQAPILEALHCGMPLVVPEDTLARELAAGAALYFEPGNVADLADKLMLIYRNEGLRARLVASAAGRKAGFSWEQAADMLWQTIAGI